MLRWLPDRLIRLYRRLAEARPYAPSTRPRLLVEPDPPKPGGRDRQFRLHIVYDAFCHHRSPPRVLFRTSIPPRDLTSWCDTPNAWTGRRRPRCPSCEQARARYLAARLGMEVMQQRASDLLSCWVGESEKQIAAAFQAARARRAMLVIDEADSLLSDRREAVRSWEVTQVNEMLTWMESHPLPFVCTTNLMDRLDQASLRRFTLKLRFEPLNPAQAALAFERFFGIAAPRRLADGLTPGDFATVRRKRDLLGVAAPSMLADWLDEEAEAKGTRVQPIGFVAGRG